MTKAKKIVLGFGAITALVIGGCFYSVSRLIGSDVCSNYPLQVVVSPDGALKAVVFERDCGATVGFNRQVSILAARDSLPNDGGNVFIVGGNAPVTVAWAEPRSLTVRSRSLAQVFVRKTTVHVQAARKEQVGVHYETPIAAQNTATRLVPAHKDKATR